MAQPANDASPGAAVLGQRAVVLAEVGRLYGIAAGSPAAHLATHPDTEWLIGRLYLTGHLTRAQRDQAERLAKVAARYEALLLAPQVHDSITLLEPRGLSTESDAAHSRRFRRARAAYELLYRRLVDAGPDAHRAVTKALRDEPPDLAELRKGLNGLLTDRKKRA